VRGFIANTRAKWQAYRVMCIKQFTSSRKL
jgi:hypothetical protein